MFSEEFLLGSSFGCFVICTMELLVILASIAVNDDFRKRENTMFFCACVSLIMVIAFDYSVENYPVNGLLPVYKLFVAMSYVSVCAYIIFFTHYMITVLAQRGFINRNAAVYIALLPDLMALLWTLDSFNLTNMFVIVNQDCTYTVTDYYYLVMAVPLLVLVFDIMLAWSFVTKDNYFSYLPWIFYGVLPIISLVLVKPFGVDVIYYSEVVALTFVYALEHNVREKKFAQSEQMLTDAKMKLMISQIQPHFMYNALNSIYYLIEQDPETAQEAVSDFSDYLRQNINALRCETTVPFSEELAHTETYLALEKMRFGDKLTIEKQIETQDFFIPPLTLQPIAENAVKHGVTKREQGGTVKIITFEDKANYFVVVDDDGVGFTEGDAPEGSGAHIGMENVKSRLRSMCDGTVLVESQVGIGTRVTICIPKEKTNETNNRS